MGDTWNILESDPLPWIDEKQQLKVHMFRSGFRFSIVLLALCSHQTQLILEGLKNACRAVPHH